ncbi:hypothetical protein BUE67_15870, partial [Corynebacterium diphtheriae]
SEGTTTFLATTMTQSDENIEKALNNIVTCYENQTLGEAAEIGGVHLEGPFISEGTTTFLATTMTQSDENIEKALNNIVTCYENQ